MWLSLLLACGTKPPAGVPSGALPIVVSRDALRVDGEALGAAHQLIDEPALDLHPPLVDRLRTLAAAGPVWVQVSADTPWFALRKVVNSAARAEAGPVHVSVAGEDRAYPLVPPPTYGLSGSCPTGPLEVHGAQPLVTLSLQQGLEESWVVADVQLLPVVAQGGTPRPVDGLPRRCLQAPDCAALYPLNSPERAACGAPAGARSRLSMGGTTGCLLPLARRGEGAARWRAELPALIATLGWSELPLLMVIPEALMPADRLTAVLGGFVDAGRDVPAVGTALLIEGNDGAPTCDAQVRDAAALSVATARWVGSLGVPAP